jgi:hypothetical protein
LVPKTFIVGKPDTPYCPPSDLCVSASTAPTLTIPFNAVATRFHSGAKFLQSK